MYHLITRLSKAALIRILSLLLLLSVQLPGYTQNESDYYETFTDYLTTRVYLSKKYTSVGIEGPEGTQTLRYRPNSLTTMGINASYRALSLTLGSGFGFLNPGREEKGKTKSFDFQTHLYTRDWVTDIYGQFYRGYYLRSAGA